MSVPAEDGVRYFDLSITIMELERYRSVGKRGGTRPFPSRLTEMGAVMAVHGTPEAGINEPDGALAPEDDRDATRFLSP